MCGTNKKKVSQVSLVSCILFASKIEHVIEGEVSCGLEQVKPVFHSTHFYSSFFKTSVSAMAARLVLVAALLSSCSGVCDGLI